VRQFPRELNTAFIGNLQWLDSAALCALADEERYFGHIVRANSEWIAFDATRPNDDSTGFRVLGLFPSRGDAKWAVERAAQGRDRAAAA
jgi:hypothetical protein